MAKKDTLFSFIEKANKVHQGYYGYSFVDYINSRTKVKIICPEHGEFMQEPKSHLSGRRCPKCGDIVSSKKQAQGKDAFIEKAKEVHGDRFDYSLVEYINSREKVTIICPEHGEFTQRPTRHLSGDGCQKCWEEKHYVTREEFVNRASKVHNGKFDYSLVDYKNMREKITIICPVHGEFEQIAALHIAGNGCIKCKPEKISLLRTFTPEEVLDKVSNVHGDRYTYDLSSYKNSRDTKLKIICPEHGEFEQLFQNHINGRGCSKCSGSRHEREISEWLDAIGIEYTFNTKEIIYPLELDFYFPKYNLALEFNGIYWHSELAGKDKYYHFNKYDLCKNQGITLFHVFEDEWINNADIIKSKLLYKFNKIKINVYARNCTIDTIDNNAAREFLNENHLQGNGRANVKLGLFNNDELVAVMTFSKSRFNMSYEYEINRFAVKKCMNVVGGAGKLFKHFIRNYQPSSVISYADLRYGEGDVYKQLGFEFSHRSYPNYWYTKDHFKRESRIKYQKHKISEGFDPALTEWEIMQQKGYDRIWDCGNNVWIWNS